MFLFASQIFHSRFLTLLVSSSLFPCGISPCGGREGRSEEEGRSRAGGGGGGEGIR